MIENLPDNFIPTLSSKLAYGAGFSGVIIAGLTINEMVGVAVGGVSIITMILTTWLNAKHKKKALELIEIQLQKTYDNE